MLMLTRTGVGWRCLTNFLLKAQCTITSVGCNLRFIIIISAKSLTTLLIFLFFLDDLDNLDASLSSFFSLMTDMTQLAASLHWDSLCSFGRLSQASLHCEVMGFFGGLFGDSEDVGLDDSE